MNVDVQRLVFGAAAMPSEVHDADRWRALAAEARAVADEMTDPEAKRIMLHIAAGYDLLAGHAEARQNQKK